MPITAFYLPQFHPIPENDQIYGAGFTEWDNVRRARPLFAGHYQPHLPHPRLGFYSLLDTDFLEQQHALARAFGVDGFCYYYYNFAGRRLLEKPLLKIRRNRAITNSFCLCWVHTDWYDNRLAPKTPFITQTYSAKNALGLFLDLLPYLEDSRYICVDNRPLLLIWAPERHPCLPMYADILREASVRHGLKNLFLAGVEAYLAAPPSLFGLDCMVEFAPDWRRENHVSADGEKPVRIDYAKTVAFMRQKEIPPYTRLRCAFPGWDNTPRRGYEGIACVGQSATLFGENLQFLADYTRKVLPPSLQMLFINAWNEWGEGCHLEPDEQNGFAYLEQVRSVASWFSSATGERVS